MIVTRRRKHPDQSPTPCQKLFANYPYLITTELNKTSDRSCALQWCKDRFHKIVDTLHTRRNHDKSTSITEESFEQEPDNENSTKGLVNNTKRTRTSLITSSMNNQEVQNHKTNMTKSDHQIDYDPG